jgi:hypothetical protein
VNGRQTNGKEKERKNLSMSDQVNGLKEGNGVLIKDYGCVYEEG